MTIELHHCKNCNQMTNHKVWKEFDISEEKRMTLQEKLDSLNKESSMDDVASIIDDLNDIVKQKSNWWIKKFSIWRQPNT